MDPLRLTALSFTAVSLLASGISCTSDANPFDLKTTTTETAPAIIRLQLSVAATRADMSTAAEKKVSKVSVYVFDENNKLEALQENIAVSADTPAELEATPGQKTVYALACKSLNSPSVSIEKGISLNDFENNIFSSTLNDLKTTSEFVMVGKSKPQMVYRSSSVNDLPASNVFEVELVRLVAKTQVKVGVINTEDFGFTHGNGSYYIAQTCNKMRLQPNGTDVMTFESPSEGTFAGYNPILDNRPTNCVTGDFTATDCTYMSENIVNNPVAGNTTFAILALPVTPKNTYQYNTYNGTLTASPVTGYVSTFYTVGLVDKSNGVEDFAVNPNPENNHVLTFGSLTDANNYRDALNGGATSAMTVSEVDSPMGAPRKRAAVTEASDVQIRNFETITFSGMAYYRINISDEDGNLKVERNKFYKITVNSIKSLGCHTKEMLYPQNAFADFNTSTSAMVGVKFKIADWDEVNSGVDIE